MPLPAFDLLGRCFFSLRLVDEDAPPLWFGSGWRGFNGLIFLRFTRLLLGSG